MSFPLSSVVLTTYNRAGFLKRAVDSVLRQTLIDFELIIVDDCSSDGTEALVKTFTDVRIRYLRHTNNRGVSAARNSGINAAKANHVSFLDDDDEYFPDFLAQTQAYLQRYPEVGFIWTGVTRVFENKRKTQSQIWNTTRRNGQVISDKEMIFLNQFSASNGFTVGKAPLRIAGYYDETMTVSEDLDLVFRLVSTGCDYHAIPAALIQINIHQSSSLSRTSTLLKHIQSTEQLIANNLALMKKWPIVWLHYHTVLLANYYRAHEITKARFVMRQIFAERLFYLPAWERIFRFEFKRVKRLFNF